MVSLLACIMVLFTTTTLGITTLATALDWVGGDAVGHVLFEIGAVLLCGISNQPISDYQEFILPVEYPQLSEFCKKLTTIKQSQIDTSYHFPDVGNPSAAKPGVHTNGMVVLDR